jgi:hypothetical protein
VNQKYYCRLCNQNWSKLLPAAQSPARISLISPRYFKILYFSKDGLPDEKIFRLTFIRQPAESFNFDRNLTPSSLGRRQTHQGAAIDHAGHSVRHLTSLGRTLVPHASATSSLCKAPRIVVSKRMRPTSTMSLLGGCIFDRSLDRRA